MPLPPPPLYAEAGSHAWNEWYRQLQAFLTTASGGISWNAVSKSGANLTDIPTRNHNDLQNIQGGITSEYYHLREKDYTSVAGLSILTAGTYNVTAISNGYLLCDCTSGAITVNLPAASTFKRFHIVKTDSSANAVTINRNGSDTIEGAASASLAAQYNNITIFSGTGSVWYEEDSV